MDKEISTDNTIINYDSQNIKSDVVEVLSLIILTLAHCLVIRVNQKYSEYRRKKVGKRLVIRVNRKYSEYGREKD